MLFHKLTKSFGCEDCFCAITLCFSIGSQGTFAMEHGGLYWGGQGGSWPFSPYKRNNFLNFLFFSAYNVVFVSLIFKYVGASQCGKLLLAIFYIDLCNDFT